MTSYSAHVSIEIYYTKLLMHVQEIKLTAFLTILSAHLNSRFISLRSFLKKIVKISSNIRDNT